MIASLRRYGAAFLLLAITLSAGAMPARAVEKDEDGLPLPRFATTRSAPINVRVGPGQKYDVAWIFNRPGMPVEITAEFDIWRKIRDFDGSEGWVQQNLLSGARAGLVTPWKKGGDVPLLAAAADGAAVKAYLSAGFRVEVKRCDGSWCQVEASAGSTYTGYLKQAEIWGVYQDESF
ncbi:MAG: SH3 domain-containing protein [Devosia sp.]|nr:SH3 domain-containing protein [Devosia sp.]